MLKIKGISRVMSEDVYYLIIISNSAGMACEIKPQDAQILLKNNLYKEKKTDPKTQIKEYEFLDSKK